EWLARGRVKLRVGKPRLGEKAPSVALAEGESDAGAGVRQRHRQAVHDADAVLDRSHRVTDVVLKPVGRMWLTKEEHTVGCKACADTVEPPCGFDLVVQRVEHDDRVKWLADVELRDVRKLEAEVGQATFCGLLPRAT